MPGNSEERDAARADLSRCLAACYYEPGPEFAEERLFDSMREAAQRIDPALAARARRLGEAFAAEPIETLLVDYTRLFLGPNGGLAKPYGSVWLEGTQTLMQDSTLEVQRLYDEGGFALDEAFHELPDHVAAELEFLYLLLYRELQARRSAEPEAAAFARLRRRFLDRHLGRWVMPFAAALRSGAGQPFYRELADLTERFVLMESAAPREAS